ncbi:glycoside hydrolase domain-containing protein [Nonomuraea sp. NPDC050536]|uniref:glycoside hydrolase domain-containing protein n=1 Tax=Nonomuraea sp. NPDC050536 TaxID=3364366 RepID=UPI0037CBF0BE
MDPSAIPTYATVTRRRFLSTAAGVAAGAVTLTALESVTAGPAFASSAMGLDSNEDPDPGQIAAAGYTFLSYYLTGSGSMTAAKVAACAAHGVAVIANYEHYQNPFTLASPGVPGRTDGRSPFDGGRYDAQLALAAANNCGIPGDRPIYFSIDIDVLPSQFSAADAYMDGVASVLPPSRIGVYSSTWYIDHLAGNGKATWFWQSKSTGFSGGANGTLNPHTNIWQQSNPLYVYISGKTCDWNYVITGDYGQWGTGPSTKHVYALAPSGVGVYQWSGSGQNWTQIGGSAGALYAGGSQLFATNPTSGDIYHYNGVPNNWSRIGGPGYTFAAAGNTLFGMAPNRSAVYQWTGGSNWTQIGGPAGTLYAGGAGLFATNPTTRDIYRYNGVPNNWSRIGGPGFVFAVTNNTIYGLSPQQSAVFAWTGGSTWTQIGGPASYLYGGGQGLLAINPSTSDVYHYNGTPNNWSRIGGPGYSFASTDNVTIAVSPNQDGVFAWSGSGTAWSQIGGPADELVTGS